MNRRTLAYWLVTGFLSLEQVAAGTLDLLRAAPLYPLLLHLGYPPHFATVLGTWKVLGALALVWPRTARLKEWAYAGMFIDFTAAVVAHASAADAPTTFIGPFASLAALLASWSLRPSSRRL